MSRTFRRPALDGAEQHRNWLSLVEVSGPFLSLPVLRGTWPTLDALDKKTRERLRQEHATWQADTAAGQQTWIGYVLSELLGWGDVLHTDGLDTLAHTVAEHDTELRPSFALVEPGEEIKPDSVRMLGLVCPAGSQPTARIRDSAWAATPVDRLAHLCRHHNIELGLVTDGRWWTLVWAPRGGVTTTAVFDAVAWPEAAERDVVRAFTSLLSRHRFFGVPDAERLVPLLRASLGSQEEITEALGVQVRQAVELLVAAMGRTDVRDRDLGGRGLQDVDAHEVYRGAVAVMMRIVFLLFAEERKLLPADNELYAAAYSAGRLCAELEQRVIEGSEEDLEHSSAAWHRLLALFNAVYRGVDHPRLIMHGHDGSLFDPEATPWLPLTIDDRTVLHMLRSVQYVEVGAGRSRERRTVSFRTLGVEQIGYVYEGLLSFEGFRAEDVTVGLIGKEGLEEEVRLTDLEAAARQVDDVPALAKALAEKYKDSKIGSVPALTKKLAPLDGVEREEARKKLLAVTGGDYPLSERLLPFAGIIREDLRGLPVVILPGALFVTESTLRRNTGTHYTPRFLAEEVVEGALEPLVYEPGPLQTADKSQWKPKSSKEILALKVADIAMGSAAFLVAAARYLAGHLIEAWSREGDERALAYQQRGVDRPVDADEDPLVVEARRQVIEHCLYGVDINPMAVEMAKLSLWLVSMDPQRPFTFLDDRLVNGDSLLGITSLEQLEYMHLDPKQGRKVHEGALWDWTSGVRSLVAAAAGHRRKIADTSLGNDPVMGLARKRELLRVAQDKTKQLRLFADLAVGSALANVGKGEPGLNSGSVASAKAANDVAAGNVDENAASDQGARWLATDHVSGSFDRRPLHWPLFFPEVFEQGGFDAIIGNPPFFGGLKIAEAVGRAYRDYLVAHLGRGVRGIRGTADLVAYFVCRSASVLNSDGQLGIVATSTLAEGDTRRVGLDQIVSDGLEIRQAVKSKPWPSRGASLEYCAIWVSRASLTPEAGRLADGNAVSKITTSLESVSQVVGQPFRLASNKAKAFQGFNVLGSGFVVDPEWAKQLIEKSEVNSEVLAPFLGGQDVNSRPDASASRWVINFHDWSEEHAADYPECYDRVRRLVLPERVKNKQKSRRERWWQYSEYRRGLVEGVAGLEQVIVLALVSRTLMPVRVPTGQVFSHKLAVFCSQDYALLSMLSSNLHYLWFLGQTSRRGVGGVPNYSPSDVFETFSMPELTPEMRELGNRLDTYRRDVMLSRQGLTTTYNSVFAPNCHDEDIVELRRIHRDIDEAVCRAYGWDDLVTQGLDHGFHKPGAYTRYTFGPTVQREVLNRLLELNHQRYKEEKAQGLHDKKRSGRSKSTNGEQGTLI
ncbi:SAM-dependent DNA methyltransferase [Micromonospora sp. DSM 115977]|uniref:site-specific DNA-methyltransferase (adenine-specific) n=1 Tax=Micromonospora reichwaldensis TaxID=3075516 RepID=A0ABU2X3G0_9ACTN|nr:type IIL restriction-modification enzyme MmeI [Micromonospora sp. DSM 115977]MDT0532310.1 SAM-dependent DNA methyltransferase [Micromonospora sp. DSM 115977]